MNETSLIMKPKHMTVTLLWTAGLFMLPLIMLPACTQEKKIVPAEKPAERIISLSPSISRQMVDLGAEDFLVGVTSYDDYRGNRREIVGTLIQPNIERIVLLKPDLVLYSAEDGLVQNAERLADVGIASRRFARNKNFDDIADNYLILADVLGREDTARGKIKQYRMIRDHIIGGMRDSISLQRPLAAFLLSCSPLIVASADSFIGQIIWDAGGRCPYGGGGGPHPLISIETLVESDPDLIISMSGGEDTGGFFRRLAADFSELKAVRSGNIFTIKDDSVPYYTPADYVKSLEKIAVMIQKVKAPSRVLSTTTGAFVE